MALYAMVKKGSSRYNCKAVMVTPKDDPKPRPMWKCGACSLGRLKGKRNETCTRCGAKVVVEVLIG